MTGFGTPGFRTLENFYESVQFQNPAMAHLMHADLMKVGLGGISGNRLPAYEAVIRLRRRAEGLPVPFAHILDYALEDLGYVLEHVMKES